jgi:hypothetical protein
LLYAGGRQEVDAGPDDGDDSRALHAQEPHDRRQRVHADPAAASRPTTAILEVGRTTSTFNFHGVAPYLGLAVALPLQRSKQCSGQRSNALIHVAQVAQLRDYAALGFADGLGQRELTSWEISRANVHS